MSIHAPVYWHEGMFLRPQHFQIAEQNFQSELRHNVHWDRHYSWGLRKFQFDRDALANNRIVITELAARMRDGTLISAPQSGNLPELDLRQAMQSQQFLTLFIAIPKTQSARTSASSSGAIPNRIGRLGRCQHRPESATDTSPPAEPATTVRY